MVCIVTAFVNWIKIARASKWVAYRGLSKSGGNCAASLVRIMHLPPKCVDWRLGNASHNLMSIFSSNLGPMNLISLIRMYLIYLISSWNMASVTYLLFNFIVISYSYHHFIVASLTFKDENKTKGYHDPNCINFFYEWDHSESIKLVVITKDFNI